MVEIEGVPYWTDAIGQIPFALNEYKNVFERSKNSEIVAGETIDIGKKFGDGSLMNIIFPSPDYSNGYDNAMIVRAVNWAKKRYRLTPTRMSNGQYEMRVGKTSYSPKNVTGIKWEEHDSGLSFRKQIVQEYDGKQMPLSSYSRCMPWELSQE